MLSNLRVEQAGRRLTLVPIAADKIQTSQLAPGKGVPAVTLQSGGSPNLEFHYGSRSGGIAVPLAFTDPNGARPGGCFRIRLKSQPPGPFGGFPVVAFASEPDGKTSGTFALTLLPGFDPIGDVADYVLDLFPMSAVDPTKEAIEEALAGSPIAIGSALPFNVHMSPSTPTPPTGGTASTCSSDSACAAFGKRNCQPQDGARCGGDKLCHCCLALCGSGTGACSCTKCDGNCSGDRMCVGSTCVFKVGAGPSQ